ncbi:uncharacterized protein TNCV_451171 [Trichonephila clavipes]|nr:uncharacterized protein TNCV_451171 [Trichonephila clavipes]
MPGPVFGNRIVDLELIVEAFAQLCCPKCFAEKVELFEDSRYELCSHFTIKCKCCDFFFAFASSKKVVNAPVINTKLVYGMRQIGKGFAEAFKLCSTLNLPRLSKTAYQNQDAKLLKVVQEVAEESIKAATEIVEKKQNLSSDIVKCGISVDGTWQRRGYTSMNGCVAAISVDTGKVLDKEVMSSHCPTCKRLQTMPRNFEYESSKADHVNSKNFLRRCSVTLRGFSNSIVRLFEYFKDDIQIDELKFNVEICVVDDDAMLFGVIIGLNILMQGETIINENGITIKNKPKCIAEVATLSVLPINLSPVDIEINIAPEIPQIYGSKNKTITPNCMPVKKGGLHVKDDQRTVTPDEYIVSDTEEFLFENCLKDVKEDKACIRLKKTDTVIVLPESVPKGVKRRAHEKRRPRIKENKDYYFIPKRRQKIENSVAYCDHRVLMNHKPRKKEDVPLKTCHIDHLGPHRITEIEEGVMEQTVRFEQDLQYHLVVWGGRIFAVSRLEDQPIPGWPCGANRYFQATPIILLLMLTNALSVLGACQSLDAQRGGSRRNLNVVRRLDRKTSKRLVFLSTGTSRTPDSQTPGSRTAVHVLMGEKEKKMSGAS